MKLARVNQGYIGLVFRNGDYRKFIEAGLHVLYFNEEVQLYNMSLVFNAPVLLEILMKDAALMEKLQIVEINDSQLGILYKNGLYQSVLKPGRYMYWKGLVTYQVTLLNLQEIEVSETMDRKILNVPEVRLQMHVYEVEPHEKAVLIINDQFVKILESGIYRFWKNENVIRVMKADLRMQNMEISGQEILTQDKAVIRINFNTQYKVTDIMKALLEHKDYEKQLYVIIQLAIRTFVGNKTLDELLENKDNISASVLQNVKGMTEKMGVKIENCGIKDVILTGEMRDIMNRVLVAEKKAQANIITRREETASTRSLLNTAKLMEENTMLFKLKEMEFIENIADKVGNISISGQGNLLEQIKEAFTAKS